MKKLLAVAAVFIFLLAGCTEDSEQAEPSTTNDFNTNTLTLFMPSPDTLHPLYSVQTSNMKIYDLIYDSLICLDNSLSVVPQLSESCTVSADCKSITFTLRSGVTWHDGVPFTSEDVKYTVDLLKRADYTGPYRQNVSRIARVEIVDDLHFTVYLDSPYARILNLLTFPIVPAHHTNLDTEPCGTGQYRFSEFHEKSYMLLTKNTLWTLGEVPIEESVRVNIVDDTDDIASILNLGEISAVTISATDLPETGIVKSMQQLRYTSLNYEFIGFNFSNRVFAEKDVRRAVSAALDRHSLLDGTYFGVGTQANCPIPPRAYFYNKEIDGAEYEEGRHAAILLEASWADSDANGVYDKHYDDGILYSLEATLLVNEDNPFRVRCAQSICAQLAERGIRVTAEAVPWEEYNERISEGKYSLFLGGMDLSADLDLSSLLSGDGNYMNYYSEKMDEALNDISRAVSTEDVKNAYMDFEYVFTDDLPCTGLFFTDDILLCSDRIEGADTPSPTRPFADINRWHFSNK